MKILTNYIGKTILTTIALAVMVLLTIDLFFNFVNELRYLGTGDYNLLQIFSYLFLTIPKSIYSMFPMSILIGTLLGLGYLARNNELTVMQASGVGYKQLLIALSKVAIILIFLITLIGEIIAPKAISIANSYRSLNLSKGQAIETAYGTWLRDYNSYIHIAQFISNTNIAGVTRYIFDENLQLKKASFADYGKFDGKRWQLQGISETIFTKDKIITHELSEEAWESKLKPQVLEVVVADKNDLLTSTDLINTIKYNKINNLDNSPYKLKLYTKLFNPLAIIVMICLALPFVLGPLRSSSTGLKLLVGMLTGFAFYVVNNVFGHFTYVYGLWPFFGALLPSVIFAGLCAFLLRRQHN